MGNPARDLAALLAAWPVPANATAETTRGDPDARSGSFWGQHRDALRMVVDIDRMVETFARQGRDLSYIQEIIPDLYRAVFAVTTPWSSITGAPRDALDPATIRTLRVFADFFQEYDIEFDVTGTAAVRQGLEDVEQIVLSATVQEIPRNTRIYLLGLIRDALDALTDPSHDGGRRARTATHAVTGALTAELVTIPTVAPPATGPAGTKSLKQKLSRAVAALVTSSVLAFGTSYGAQAGEAAWTLTESTLSQVFADLSQEAKTASNPPAIEAPKTPLEIGPGPAAAPGDPDEG